MPKDTDEVKENFLSKISPLSAAAKAAAIVAWNAALDRMKATFTQKLGAIAALKVADSLINSRLSSAADAAKVADTSLKKDVANPVTKMLASSESPRLSNLKNGISSTTSDSGNYTASLSSISRRNEYNKGALEDEEKELNQNIETLDQLKI